MGSTDENSNLDAPFLQVASQPLYTDATACRKKKGLVQRLVAFFKPNSRKAHPQEMQQQQQQQQEQEQRQSSFSVNQLSLSREENASGPKERTPFILHADNEKRSRVRSRSLYGKNDTDYTDDNMMHTDCDTGGPPSARHSALTILLAERVAEPLTGNDPWRFAVVLSYSVLTMSNTLQAASFSPIPHEVCQFFDTTMLEVNLLSSIYLVVYALTVVMSCKAFESVGLQRSLAFAAILNTLGASVKLVALYVYPRPPLLFVAQCINALSQVFIIAHPPAIASLWFSDSHRTAANATMTAALSIGFAIGVVMPTLFMHSGTDHSALYLSFERLFWTYLGLAVISFILVMTLFPKRPRFAASAMAAEAIQYDLRRVRTMRLRTHRYAIEKKLRHQRRQREQRRQQAIKEEEEEEKQRQSKNVEQEPSATTSSSLPAHGHDDMTQTAHCTVTKAESAVVTPPLLMDTPVMLSNNKSDKTHTSGDNNNNNNNNNNINAEEKEEEKGKDNHYTCTMVRHRASCTPHKASLNDDAVRGTDSSSDSIVDSDADFCAAEDIKDTYRSGMTEKERTRRSLFVAVAAATAPGPVEGHTDQCEARLPPDELEVIILSLEAKLQRIREAEIAHPTINVFQMMRESLRLLKECRNFSLLTISNTLIIGSAWSLATVMPQAVTPLGISESLIGWIGFVNLFLGGLLAPVLAPLIIGKERNFKRAVLICGVILVADMCIMLVLAAVIQKGFSLVIVFFIGWGGIAGMIQNVVLPLFLEFGVELTYPASQATSAAISLWAANAGSFLMTQVSSFILGGKPSVREMLIAWGISTGFTLLGTLTLVAVRPHHFREEYEARRLALQISAAEREESLDEGEPRACKTDKI